MEDEHDTAGIEHREPEWKMFRRARMEAQPTQATVSALAELAGCRSMAEFVRLRGRQELTPRLLILASRKGPRVYEVKPSLFVPSTRCRR